MQPLPPPHQSGSWSDQPDQLRGQDEESSTEAEGKEREEEEEEGYGGSGRRTAKRKQLG